MIDVYRKNMTDFKVSVVVPAYNEAENVIPLTDRLVPLLSQYADYEVIFVDDGSCDKTVETIKALHQKNSKINYISFSKNFGHQYALRAGIDYATGDCIVSMDADLQHPPELVAQMVAQWQNGHDIVYTIRRETKGETFFKKLSSGLFYKVFSFFSGLNLPKGTADFRLLDKKAANVIRGLSERNLFLRGMVFWMGFKQKAILYDAEKRFAGKSTYTLKKMISLAVLGATSFSVKPLRIAIYLGLLIATMGGLFTAYVLYMRLFNGAVITGWASIMSVILILGGVQLFMTGIIGEYIGMIFMETKKRPIYIVAETTLTNKE